MPFRIPPCRVLIAGVVVSPQRGARLFYYPQFFGQPDTLALLQSRIEHMRDLHTLIDEPQRADTDGWREGVFICSECSALTTQRAIVEHLQCQICHRVHTPCIKNAFKQSMPWNVFHSDLDTRIANAQLLFDTLQFLSKYALKLWPLMPKVVLPQLAARCVDLPRLQGRYLLPLEKEERMISRERLALLKPPECHRYHGDLQVRIHGAVCTLKSAPPLQVKGKDVPLLDVLARHQGYLCQMSDAEFAVYRTVRDTVDAAAAKANAASDSESVGACSEANSG